MKKYHLFPFTSSFFDLRLVLAAAFALSILISCTNQEETLQARKNDNKNRSGENNGSNTAAQIFGETHKANEQNGGAVLQGKVIELLKGGRYAYLKITKTNGDSEWVVTRQAAFTKGQTYRYGEGLVKTGYYSTDLQRTFETIRLISDIAPLTTSSGSNDAANAGGSIEATRPDSPQSPIKNEQAIPLVDIIKTPEKYAGKTITVSGKVMKINPNIMNRHWIHIQDGTANDYDFVLTAQKTVPVGHVATFRGVLNTQRDFGAGYRYDIILEHAELAQ